MISPIVIIQRMYILLQDLRDPYMKRAIDHGLDEGVISICGIRFIQSAPVDVYMFLLLLHDSTPLHRSWLPQRFAPKWREWKEKIRSIIIIIIIMEGTAIRMESWWIHPSTAFCFTISWRGNFHVLFLVGKISRKTARVPWVLGVRRRRIHVPGAWGGGLLNYGVVD